MNKQVLVADEDFIVVSVRQENLNTVPGAPVMVQMSDTQHRISSKEKRQAPIRFGSYWFASFPRMYEPPFMNLAQHRSDASPAELWLDRLRTISCM